ncbi:MAG: TraR/DksA C4-type zinc finger protein [Prosthecobacter sp.]|nr:TraR/DksA C4-type zinc finger protein [Prosthecobacter sp.]
MPAKKKSAPKAPAKPAKKAPLKPAAKKPAKAAKATPPPKSKPAAKVEKKQTSKPAPPKSHLVTKAPAKAPSKATPAAKKPAAKAAPAKKEAPAAKAPAKPAAPAKKESPKAAKAPEAPKAAAKAAAPVPAPAPAPAKKEAPKSASALAKAAARAPFSKAGPMVKITNVRRTSRIEDEGITIETPKKPVLPAAFLKKQRHRLVELRDAYLNSAEGVANESLRKGSDGGDSSAFGMHQADAGSDAYDKDFALSLLAKEQDAIYEINEALKRIDIGTYGLCEMSGKVISEERLEALPFTRFTVACQERLEREQMGGRWNRPVRSLFGLDEAAEDSDDEREEEETTTTTSESLDFSKE